LGCVITPGTSGAVEAPSASSDTRTLRETEPGQHTATLSGRRVWPTLRALAEKHGLRARQKRPLLLVLPTPLLPHRVLCPAQWSKGLNVDLFKGLTLMPTWSTQGPEDPRVRYAGDYELYPNHLLQRDELVVFLHYLIDPTALIIFSGDVHCGSVVNGLYVGTEDAAIRAGRGDWALRIAQVTSSPIKNQLPEDARRVIDELEGTPRSSGIRRRSQYGPRNGSCRVRPRYS
jgi:hypothetical protein